jgi:hypothetical protein
VYSYPFAVLGFFQWRAGRKKNPASKLNRVAGRFLGLGLVLSVAVVFIFSVVSLFK